MASPSGVPLTFAELAGRAHQIVHALRAQSVEAGDVIAYALPNDIDVVFWQLASQGLMTAQWVIWARSVGHRRGGWWSH